MVRREWLAERPPPAPGAACEAGTAERVAERCADLVDGSARALTVEAVAQSVLPLRLSTMATSGDSGQLSLQLSDADGATLLVCVEPTREDARYYERTSSLGIWYVRDDAHTAELPSWSTGALQAVVRAVLTPNPDALAAELAAERRATNGSSTAPDAPARSSHASVDPARPYARMSVLGPNQVEHFFHVDYQFDDGADVDQPPTTRLGIIYQCNQPCTFCQLAEMNTHIPPPRIYAALDASRARGARRVILTGGEPTLCKHLPDYIAYAREKGYTTIELQTNATLLGDAQRATRLRQAGLTDAQVSLHGPDSAISDHLTAAPGTHQQTLAGIGNLLDTGVRVLLNHLIFRDNCHLLLDFIEMVEQRWGQHRERIIIQFHSPLSEFTHVEHGRKHIARYTEYAGLLRRAIDRGRALGYWVKDLQDPTGIPALCILGADADYLGPILSQRIKPRLHRWETGWMTRVTACQRCEIADACMGIPRGYLELHGDEEFRPIHVSDLG